MEITKLTLDATPIEENHESTAIERSQHTGINTFIKAHREKSRGEAYARHQMLPQSPAQTSSRENTKPYQCSDGHELDVREPRVWEQNNEIGSQHYYKQHKGAEEFCISAVLIRTTHTQKSITRKQYGIICDGAESISCTYKTAPTTDLPHRP